MLSVFTVAFWRFFLSFFRHLDPCQHASQHHQQLELAVQPFAASIIVLHSLTVNSNFTCDCSLPALVSSSVPVFPRTVSFSVPLHWRFPRWRCPQVQSWRPFSLQFLLGTQQVWYLKQLSRWHPFPATLLVTTAVSQAWSCCFDFRNLRPFYGSLRSWLSNIAVLSSFMFICLLKRFVIELFFSNHGNCVLLPLVDNPSLRLHAIQTTAPLPLSNNRCCNHLQLSKSLHSQTLYTVLSPKFSLSNLCNLDFLKTVFSGNMHLKLSISDLCISILCSAHSINFQ